MVGESHEFEDQTSAVYWVGVREFMWRPGVTGTTADPAGPFVLIHVFKGPLRITTDLNKSQVSRTKGDRVPSLPLPSDVVCMYSW